MAISRSAVQVGRTLLTGVAGVMAFDVAKRLARQLPGREMAVGSVATGLRVLRNVERGAESARLTTADVVAEARQRIGEQAPPPGAPLAGHDHSH